MRAAPAVARAMGNKKAAHEHTCSAENIRHSLRNGFTAYIALTRLPYASTPLVSTSPDRSRSLSRPATDRAHDAVASTASHPPTFGDDGQCPFLRERITI